MAGVSTVAALVAAALASSIPCTANAGLAHRLLQVSAVVEGMFVSLCLMWVAIKDVHTLSLSDPPCIVAGNKCQQARLGRGMGGG